MKLWVGRYKRGTPLHCAASAGYTETVELLLSKGASIEGRNLSHETPLHCATLSGQNNTVELLLSKGASIAARNTKSETPLDIPTRSYIMLVQ